jgi:hypothetical protein
VAERSIRFRRTPVSRDNSDPRIPVTYCNPHDRWDYKPESPIYETPYAHNQYTTFIPVPPNSGRADYVRRIPSEYN